MNETKSVSEHLEAEKKKQFKEIGTIVSHLVDLGAISFFFFFCSIYCLKCTYRAKYAWRHMQNSLIKNRQQ